MTNHQRGRLTRAVAGTTRIVGVCAALPLLGMLTVGSSTPNAAVLRLNSAFPSCARTSRATRLPTKGLWVLFIAASILTSPGNTSTASSPALAQQAGGANAST